MEKTSFHWFIPHVPAVTKAESRRQALSLDLHGRWQGPNFLSCPLLPPGKCIRRKLELVAELGLEGSHLEMGCRNLKWHCNC